MAWAATCCFAIPLVVSVIANWQLMPEALHRMGGQTAAAWVQGVGTVVAVMVAVAIPQFQRRQGIRDRRTAAYVLVDLAVIQLDLTITSAPRQDAAAMRFNFDLAKQGLSELRERLVSFPTHEFSDTNLQFLLNATATALKSAMAVLDRTEFQVPLDFQLAELERLKLHIEAVAKAVRLHSPL